MDEAVIICNDSIPSVVAKDYVTRTGSGCKLAIGIIILKNKYTSSMLNLKELIENSPPESCQSSGEKIKFFNLFKGINSDFS